MRKLNKKGFTLIELLVVIAIIGILASIVLVSLNSARQKGYDTQVKSDLAQARNVMEMCYDNQGGTYVGCLASAAVVDVLNNNPACSALYAGNESASAWAISGGLCSSTQDWCVDSVGKSKSIADGARGVATVCP